VIHTANGPPNDVRNFVHKRLIKAATGFVTSGFNPLAAVSGFITGGSSAQKQAGRALKIATRPPTALPVQRRIAPPPPAFAPASIGQIFRPRAQPRPVTIPQIPFINRCIPPFFDDGQGGCTLDLIPGPGGGGTGANRDIGQAVMGRYGAAEVPGNLVVNRAICRPGMVVADDGLCYNKSQVRNSQRQWPRGRRPLLTGGDMRAISTAARAGARLERTTKRLQKIGLMKKPPPRQKRITSGPTDHHHHE